MIHSVACSELGASDNPITAGAERDDDRDDERDDGDNASGEQPDSTERDDESTGDDAATSPDGDPAEGDPTKPPSGGQNEAPVETQLSDCKANEAGPETVPLRRFTSSEFRSALSVIFPDVEIPELSLPASVVVADFNNNVMSQPNNPLLIDSEVKAATAVAAAALANRTAWAPCTENDVSCLTESLEATATRAFRRPPNTDERERLNAFASAQLEADGFDAALQDGLIAIILSPQTLYRTEFGSEESDSGRKQLTGYEVATRLSFLLWNQIPDSELIAIAESGSLDTAEGVAAQAQAMLADERAQGALRNFLGQWLQLNKIDVLQLSGEQFAALTPDLRASYRASIERFIDWALWEEKSLDALLTSDQLFLDARLAELLGVAAPADESTPVQVDNRLGILTHPAILAATSHGSTHSPILRGLRVLRNFLCIQIPAPPPGVNAAVAQQPAGEAVTTRQHVQETHSGKAECAACHDLIDGVGFTFENYDALGRYITTENGVDVDATGMVPLSSGPRDVDNALELAEIISESYQVRQCVVDHLYRYAYGHVAAERAGLCEIASVASVWSESAGSPDAVLGALVSSDSFRFIAAGE